MARTRNDDKSDDTTAAQDRAAKSLYMTASEAAEALGVSVSTVYVYVSRKLLRSVKQPGARTARYYRSDVNRLRQRTSTARFSKDTLAPQGHLIGSDDNDTPLYRGQSAITLAKTETLESVALLLWRSPGAFDWPAPAVPPHVAEMDLLGKQTAADKALTLFAMIEQSDPRAQDLTVNGSARTAASVLRWFASWVAGAFAPDDRPIHEVVTEGRPDGAHFRDFVRTLLVIAADHPLDPTVYAVRAAANTGISPYRSAMSGLIAATGRRLSIARQEATLRLIDEIISARDPSDVIVGRLRDGDILPGFSETGEVADPRVDFLIELLRSGYASDHQVARLLRSIDTVAELDQRRASISLLHLFVGQRLGLGIQKGMLVRLARMVGWMAHATEQYNSTEEGIIRLRAPALSI